MPNVQKVMSLAKKIAVKARDLIPRSTNRMPVYMQGTLALHSSEWKDAPNYVALVGLAQRSRGAGGAKHFRNLVRDSNIDTTFGQTMGEDMSKELLGNQKLEAMLKSQGLTLDQLVQNLQVNPRGTKTHHKDGSEFKPLERVEGDVKNAVRYGIGNCPECASTAYMMLMDYYDMGEDDNLPSDTECQGAKVELIALGGKASDHCFVLINRNASSALVDTGKWMTNNVIVCDPWWFHKGDAIAATDNSDGLCDYIRAAAKHTKYVWCPKCTELGKAATGQETPIVWSGRQSTPTEGCLFFPKDKSHQPQWYASMNVLNTGMIGSGHSARFRSSTKQHKYRGLNYFLNDNQSIKKQLA